MAIMIPPVIPPDTPSGGEMEVFRRLRDDPGTEGWIVLHSFGLADHVEQVQGEIDFVVIIPAKGVFCLEIKSCSAAHLRRDARGLWYYGPKDKGDPFRGQDFVVLSPRADRSSTAASVNVQPWRDRLRPLPQARGGQIPYGTIQAFKGLEAPAVVVTDIETISQPLDRALLYVATTRPLQRLTIIAHSRVRDEAIRLVSSSTSVASEDR